MAGREVDAGLLGPVQSIVLAVRTRVAPGARVGDPLHASGIPTFGRGDGPGGEGRHDVVPGQPLDPLTLPLPEGGPHMLGHHRLLGVYQAFAVAEAAPERGGAYLPIEFSVIGRSLSSSSGTP